MGKILINGNFLCRNLTGIERFAVEVCNRLDKIIQANDDISILIPKNAKYVPTFKNIKKVFSEKNIKGFPKWDLIDFAKECKKRKSVALNFSNTAPLGKKCGIAFIHDIYAADCPKDFTTLRDKLVRFYSIINYRNICKNAEKIITVSNFSKTQILKRYGKSCKIEVSRIDIIGNGWEHFSDVKENYEVFQKFPELKDHDFFFTLGSLSKRKNLAWIANYAKQHMDQHFAISGKAISGLESDEMSVLSNLKNVTLLGYITDEEVKALMKKCKAFVFPSYYEGFGIPPLEAMSVGANIIISNSASLTEIYKDKAYYIDAFNCNCNLDEILKNKIDKNYSSILSEYTYDKAAEKLYNIIKMK